MVADTWRAVPPIPKETHRRARAVFSSSNFYLRLGDQLATILQGLQPALLVDRAHDVHGPIPVLALVTFFQVVEELGDTQASDALRTRVDWQYALHLPPDTLGLRQNELCIYRQRLVAAEDRKQEFQALATRLTAMRPFRGYQTICTGQLDALNAVCLLNRLNWSLEAMRHLLWALASRWPDLLHSIALPHWYTTYGADEPLFQTCICCVPDEEIAALGRRIGADIRHLLEGIERWHRPEVLQTSEVRALEQIWCQQFETDTRGEVALRLACSTCGQHHLARQEEGL